MRLATYMAERERKVFAVGGIRATKVRPTLSCECGRTRPGTAGGPVTHVMCDECEARYFPETDGRA